ncbi:MAG: hypothetical protein Q4P31_03650 [Andreesenia angusta]|nr:hypothetical protein [Andreesenia angusta]
MKTTELLEEMEAIVKEGSAVPFSRKVMVEKDDLLEIIEDIRSELPKEIEEAEMINIEKQRIINDARQEARQMKEEAELYARKKIEEAAIMREAEEIAKEKVAKAEHSADQIRSGSIAYADEVLSGIETKLSELRADIEDIYMKVQENKQELK